MRIFLDANMLFSASNEKSNLHGFILWLALEDMLVISQHAQTETIRNIQRKRPAWQPSLVQLLKHVKIVPDVPLYETIALAEKDRIILGSAIAAKCDYLLTGDKRDFGHLYGKTIGGVTIVDYVALAKIMSQRGE